MEHKNIWQIKEAKEEDIERLSDGLGISKITSRILVNRNITSVDAASNFFNTGIHQVHNPFLMKDMDLAVQRVMKAISKSEKICIYGDYDVDGSVGTTLLILFFRAIGIDVDHYIPHRLNEGYSLNRAAIEQIHSMGTDLVITVDNGIMATDEIQYAGKLGMDVIVTDHHQVGDVLPEAVAVVNPQRKDCGYPFKGICGAGVAFKLIMALRQRLRGEGFFQNLVEPNLKQSLDLLAIATVCDMVPLVDENRYFVKEGMRQLAQTKNPGLQALLKVCHITKELTTTDLGFRIGPRINACGRLEDAKQGVLMLTTQDRKQAEQIAALLNKLNNDRRDIESNLVDEVMQRIEEEGNLDSKLGVVVYDPSWHVGVVGIVASRVVEKIKRPTLILGKNDEGLIKGSGRSVKNVNLVQALRECSNHLEHFGGHEAAVGLSLKSIHLPEFNLAFDEAVKRQMTREDLREVIFVDDDLTRKDIDRKLLDELIQLEPHGMGNAKPLFAISDLKVTSKCVVGGDHLKLSIHSCGKNRDAIAFRQAKLFENVEEKKGALFSLELNKFNNIEKIQFVVRNFLS